MKPLLRLSEQGFNSFGVLLWVTKSSGLLHGTGSRWECCITVTAVEVVAYMQVFALSSYLAENWGYGDAWFQNLDYVYVRISPCGSVQCVATFHNTSIVPSFFSAGGCTWILGFHL